MFPVTLFAQAANTAPAPPVDGFTRLVDAVWLNPTWLATSVSVWAVPFWELMLGALALTAFCVALRFIQPKAYAVASTTAKEATYQPLFYWIIGMGSFLLFGFVFIPYFTFGEDVKMVKDQGLTLIMILSILLALWTASVSISEEIEGRTALTLLSKPISRRQFIIGKFLGILMPVAMVFLILGTVFLLTIAFKMGYDAKESGVDDLTEAKRMQETVQVIPGLLLAFFEAVVLAAISVAISTRLPMLPNLVICFAVYVLGHLAPMLVDQSWGRLEFVRFIAQLIATVLPNLESFDVKAAVATNVTVPLFYIGWATLYCVLYSTMVLFVALIMFEDRDLA